MVEEEAPIDARNSTTDVQLTCQKHTPQGVVFCDLNLDHMFVDQLRVKKIIERISIAVGRQFFRKKRSFP
jgi:hypothetical protein